MLFRSVLYPPKSERDLIKTEIPAGHLEPSPRGILKASSSVKKQPPTAEPETTEDDASTDEEADKAEARRRGVTFHDDLVGGEEIGWNTSGKTMPVWIDCSD